MTFRLMQSNHDNPAITTTKMTEDSSKQETTPTSAIKWHLFNELFEPKLLQTVQHKSDLERWLNSSRWNYGASKMQSTTHQPMENSMNRRGFIYHMATKILFISTLASHTYYPITYSYLSERLSNSLLNKNQILLIFMQVCNANILNPMGMLYNAVTL